MDFEKTPSSEPTCRSLAPWLTENDAPVTCSVPVGPDGTHYGSHGGNGWTWDDVIVIAKIEREENPYYVSCSCSWTYGKEEGVSSFTTLANEAGGHSRETGHLLRRHGGRE